MTASLLTMNNIYEHIVLKYMFITVFIFETHFGDMKKFDSMLHLPYL